eukprot:353813-Chlamydomonas_euryale.AAC.2
MVDKNIEQCRCDYAPLSHSRLNSERESCFTIHLLDRLRARVHIFQQFDHGRLHSIQLEYLPQRFPTDATISSGKVHKCNCKGWCYPAPWVTGGALLHAIKTAVQSWHQ